jgi:hypothetical protein
MYMMFFIENSSFIDGGDADWELLSLFQRGARHSFCCRLRRCTTADLRRRESADGTQYTFVGAVTLYTFAVTQRLRLSQERMPAWPVRP